MSRDSISRIGNKSVLSPAGFAFLTVAARHKLQRTRLSSVEAVLIEVRELSWWLWAITAALLIADRAGWSAALPLTLGLSVSQVVYFCWREGIGAFPTQVRLAFCGLILFACWPPLRWLIWAPAIGTPLQVLFGYCLLARTLSLLPWNRREPLSWSLVWRTFAARPVRGDVRQGLPRHIQ